MKTLAPLSVIASLAFLPALASAQKADDPTPTLTLPGFFPPGEMVKQAFLGVATNPVDPAMVSQLGLDPGTGLVVAHVSEDSPAASVLESYDVLTKFNDQILVNHEQLAVLVRLAGTGKKVTLEILRQGKKQNVEVTLGEREGPAADPRQMTIPGLPNYFQFPVPAPGPFGGVPGNPNWQWKWNFESKAGEDPARPDAHKPKPDPNRFAPKVPEPKPGKPAVTIRHTWNRDNVVLFYVEEDGRRRLTINKDGKEAFDGPIDTREELEKVPKEFFADVEEMLKEIPR